tara:strand:- start:167 stop:517 length:351 start_codon:yes stop_codon:yes gene_type:complete
MKGILINPLDKTIKEVVYTGDFREIYDLVDCRTFDCVMVDSENDMYIDDEGLYVDDQKYFRMVELGANYAGKALVLGHDDEGETISTTLTLQMVKDVVQWLPKTHFETPYMEFTAW